MHACQSLAPLVETKTKKKKKTLKIIVGFSFTPPLLLVTRVAISFVYCLPKTIKCAQKPKIEKKFTGIDQSSERASERVPFPTSYLQLALAHARNPRVKNDGQSHVGQIYEFNIITSLLKQHLAICEFAKLPDIKVVSSFCSLSVRL